MWKLEMKSKDKMKSNEKMGGMDMKRRSFLKASSTAVGGAVALGGAPGIIRAAETSKLRFASYISEQAMPSRLDVWFMDEVRKRSNDSIKFDTYWSSSLHNVGEHLPAVRDNRSQVTLISPGYYQSKMPATRGLEWYYRMNRADTLQRVCRDTYEAFTPLRNEWEQRHGAKVLYWTNWYHAPLITREPVNEIEGLEGKRIRGYGVATDVIERFGGSAVPMSATEVYSALERGVLDGVYGFEFVTAVSYKLHEIAPYFTEIGDGPHAPAAVVISMREWKQLPQKHREIIEEVAAEVYDHNKLADIYEKNARDAMKAALDDGVQFSSWSDAEQKRAAEIVQPAQVQEWIDNVAKPNGIDGEAMQDIVSKAIERHTGDGQLSKPYEIFQNLS